MLLVRLGLRPRRGIRAILLQVGFTRARVTAVLRELLPHDFTLTGCPAVCFCGTFLRVASTGRYPAPLPIGARTFLTRREARAMIRRAPRSSLAIIPYAADEKLRLGGRIEKTGQEALAVVRVAQHVERDRVLIQPLIEAVDRVGDVRVANR